MQGNIELTKYILTHFKNRRDNQPVPADGEYPGAEINDHIIQLIHAGYLIGHLWVTDQLGRKISPTVHGISWSGLDLLTKLDTGIEP
jgi:hypothetical protein